MALFTSIALSEPANNSVRTLLNFPLRQKLIFHSSPMPTNNPVTTTSQPSPIKKDSNPFGNHIYTERLSEHDARLAKEGRWLLERATVYDPKTFLELHFLDKSSSKVGTHAFSTSLNAHTRYNKAVPSQAEVSAGANHLAQFPSKKTTTTKANEEDTPERYFDPFKNMDTEVYALENEMYDPLVS